MGKPTTTDRLKRAETQCKSRGDMYHAELACRAAQDIKALTEQVSALQKENEDEVAQKAIMISEAKSQRKRAEALQAENERLNDLLKHQMDAVDGCNKNNREFSERFRADQKRIYNLQAKLDALEGLGVMQQDGDRWVRYRDIQQALKEKEELAPYHQDGAERINEVMKEVPMIALANRCKAAEAKLDRVESAQRLSIRHDDMSSDYVLDDNSNGNVVLWSELQQALKGE